LFAATVGSCLALNITASDQYLAIVVPGKMFAKAYKDRGLGVSTFDYQSVYDVDICGF